MPKEIIKSMNADMKKAVDHTLHEFSSLHTGKATPAMLDGVRVNAYGSTVSLKEVAAVTTPDARTIMVQPWAKSVIKEVEKGIQEANLGLNPIIDGGILRVPVPELTGEAKSLLRQPAAWPKTDVFAFAKVVVMHSTFLSLPRTTTVYPKMILNASKKKCKKPTTTTSPRSMSTWLTRKQS